MPKSLMPFTLTDDPHFYGLEISLSYILMIGLLRLNNWMVSFLITEMHIQITGNP